MIILFGFEVMTVGFVLFAVVVIILLCVVKIVRDR